MDILSLSFVLLVKCMLSFGLNIVHFQGCGKDGFSCKQNSDNETFKLLYNCQSSDLHQFHINNFNAPATVTDLSIESCDNLELSFACSDFKQLRLLYVKHINNLEINNQEDFTQVAADVWFKNISHLSRIPSGTFSENKCSPSSTKRLIFENAVIDLIETNAINLNLTYFNLKNVNVSRLQFSAISLSCATASIVGNKLENLDHLAFQIKGAQAIFHGNYIMDIASSGINATLVVFRFTENSVTIVESYGFAVLAQYIQVQQNRFEYLKAGALEKISPGIFNISNENISKIKFSYVFTDNTLHFLDAGSLQPDIESYENLASEIIFARNQMFCSCENLGWIVSKTGHGYNTAVIQNFYEIILNKEYLNVCSYSCNLSVSSVENLITDNGCSPNLTVEELCLQKEKNQACKICLSASFSLVLLVVSYIF